MFYQIVRSKNLLYLIEAGLVFLWASYFYFFEASDGVVTVYTTRDLLRSVNWWQEPVFHGPELSGSGYTPGPFFYIMSSIPLLFAPNWWTLHYLKCFLGAAAGVVAWFLGKRIGGYLLGFWLCFLYLSSKRLYISYALDWNASFQAFFCFLCLAGILLSFEKGEKKGRRYLYITSVLVGLSAQIHGSFVVYILVFVGIQIFANHFYWQPWSKRTLLVALFWFLVPSSPFMFWLLLGKYFAFLQQPPNLRIYRELFNFFSDYYQEGRENTKNIQFFWKSTELASHPFLSNKYLMFSLLLSSFLGIVCLHRKVILDRWFKRSCLLFVIIFIIYLPLFIADVSLRYMFHWQVTYILAVSIGTFFLLKGFFQVYIPSSLRTPGTYIVYFLIIPLTLDAASEHRWAVEGNQFFRQAPYDLTKEGADIFLSSTQATAVCKAIYNETGWSPDEIYRRVFALKLDNGMDFLPLCEYVVQQSTKAPQKNLESIHGYILFRQMGTESNPHLWRTWWQEQTLPPELVQALKQGDIKIKTEILTEGVVLLPYVRLNKFSLPENVYNTGYAYRAAPGEHQLTLLPMEKNRGAILSPNKDEIWFYLNECKPGQQWCRIGIRLSGQGKQLADSKELRIEIYGTPLSQRTAYLHINLAMSLQDVDLLIKCDERQFEQRIVGKLGNFYVSQSRENSYFLSPYDRLFSVPCKRDIDSIGLRIKSVKSFDHLEYKTDEMNESVLLND